MVEGLELKEPGSPRMQDGEFIEEECKFLPPPKTVAHPRLFLIKQDGSGGCEFFNREQLEYLFRCRKKEATKKLIKVDNEEVRSHMFMKKGEKFEAARGLPKEGQPKMP